MSSSSDHQSFEEMIKNAVARERRRDVGMVLAAFGVAKLSGHEETARILDRLATKMEQEDGWGGTDES